MAQQPTTLALMNLWLRCPNPAVCASRATVIELMMAWRRSLQQCAAATGRDDWRRSVRGQIDVITEPLGPCTIGPNRPDTYGARDAYPARYTTGGRRPGWRHARTHAPAAEW